VTELDHSSYNGSTYHDLGVLQRNPTSLQSFLAGVAWPIFLGLPKGSSVSAYCQDKSGGTASVVGATFEWNRDEAVLVPFVPEHHVAGEPG
jgi:hypothetical protein